jgi:hypothetical protein
VVHGTSNRLIATRDDIPVALTCSPPQRSLAHGPGTHHSAAGDDLTSPSVSPPRCLNVRHPSPRHQDTPPPPFLARATVTISHSPAAGTAFFPSRPASGTSQNAQGTMWAIVPHCLPSIRVLTLMASMHYRCHCISAGTTRQPPCATYNQALLGGSCSTVTVTCDMTCDITLEDHLRGYNPISPCW